MCSNEKLTYKITNWKQYNESLVQRGSITVWFSEDALDNWEHPNDDIKVGRPFVYSDKAIECLLTIRELLKLPYRQTEGFSRSIIKLLEADVAIPNYSSLAKRASKLGVSLKVSSKKGAIDIVVDSTGMRSTVKENGKHARMARGNEELGESCIFRSMPTREKLSRRC